MTLFDNELKPSQFQAYQHVHTNPLLGDYLRLLSILEDGWTIAEAVHMLASGKNNEGDAYLLMLMHPKSALIQRMRVNGSSQVEKLLANERVPMA